MVGEICIILILTAVAKSAAHLNLVAFRFLPNFFFQIFLFPSCKVMTMNAAKRRQDKSIAGTSTVNQSNDSRASSFNQSSPLCHFQQTKRLQQRPTQRIGLHLPQKRSRCSVSLPPIRPASRHSHISYAAASVVDVAQEDGAKREPEEDSDPDEVIMCVDMRERGTVGCCYYESSTSILRLVEDVQCGGLDVIDTRGCIPEYDLRMD